MSASSESLQPPMQRGDAEIAARSELRTQTSQGCGDQGTASRPLEFFENVLEIGNQFSSLLMTRTLLLEGTIDPELLAQALRAIRDRVPMLQSSLAPHLLGNELKWSPDLPPPELVVLPRASEEAWQRLAVEEVHRKFRYGQILWRPYLLLADDCKRAELVVTFHHAACDGTSATLLMQWVLRAYEALQHGRSLDAVVTRQCPGATCPYHRSWYEQCKATLEFGGRLLHQLRAGENDLHFAHDGPRAVPVERRRTSPWFFALDPLSTMSLQLRCRQEKATVQGALCAAMLSAAQHEFSSPPRVLSCFSNIDLRRHGWGDLLEQFGCLTYFVVTRHRAVRPGSFWDSARDASTRIAAQANAAGQPPGRWLGPVASPWLQHFMQSSRMGRTQTVGVSNLGRIRFPETADGPRVRGMYSLTGQHGVGPDAMLLAATVNERLHATLCFVEPLLGAERQAAFAARFRETLAAACRGSDGSRVSYLGVGG